MSRAERGGATRAAAFALHVDWTRCDGHGLCAELLPTVLGRDPWGFPVPLPDAGPVVRGSVPVPGAEVEHAERAVALCPLLALRLHPRADPQGRAQGQAPMAVRTA